MLFQLVQPKLLDNLIEMEDFKFTHKLTKPKNCTWTLLVNDHIITKQSLGEIEVFSK